MPASTKLSVDPSHLAMPPSVWLHINGVSLTTDIPQYQPPVHTYDYRTKHLQSPVQSPTPPLLTASPTVVSCSITMIDGPFTSNANKQNPKIENIDLPKKLFMDRQIRKAKSLPGLIKGTALSRQTPLQSTTFTSPASVLIPAPPPVSVLTPAPPPASVLTPAPPPASALTPAPLTTSSNPLTLHIQEDQLPNIPIDNDDSSLLLQQTIENQHETRRPRVYFADFNKVQFIDDNNELSHNQHANNSFKLRRHRHRLSRKPPTATNPINTYHSPSIQQPQTLHYRSLPISHQSFHSMAQESNVKKQQPLLTHRSNSSRTTQLPDIVNQSLSNEPSSNENSNGKYILQREKPLLHIPRPIHDAPVNSSLDMSSDVAHNVTNRSSSIQDSHSRTHDSDSNDNHSGMLHLSSVSMSSTSTNRQRTLLSTISLRQQFNSPPKVKSLGISSLTNNSHQQMNNLKANSHRSISLKYSNSKPHEENDDLHSNKSTISIDTRPLTANGSAKQLKRSDAIHVNTRNLVGAPSTIDSNEINRHSYKPNIHESNNERFQNLLTIVRPPYAPSAGTSANIQAPIMPTDSARQSNHQNHTKGTLRMSRSTSARGPLGFHLTSNTIIV